MSLPVEIPLLVTSWRNPSVCQLGPLLCRRFQQEPWALNGWPVEALDEVGKIGPGVAFFQPPKKTQAWTSNSLWVTFWNILKQKVILFYFQKKHEFIGKSPCLMEKSTISMAIFHCYLSSPEGSSLEKNGDIAMIHQQFTNRAPFLRPAPLPRPPPSCPARDATNGESDMVIHATTSWWLLLGLHGTIIYIYIYIYVYIHIYIIYINYI